MKSKIDWVRRSQRVIRMVSELHCMGYQNLRIMPYLHPNAWRLAVGPSNLFSELNGAVIPFESLIGMPIYSAAGGGDLYFDWDDAKGNDARALAEKFVVRFPDTAKRGLGRDWAYAGWLAELVGFLDGGDLLPVTYWENMGDVPEQLEFLPIWDTSGENIGSDEIKAILDPDVKKFPLPPCQLNTQLNSDYKSQAQNSSDDILLLHLVGEGGGLHLVLRMTEGGIYSYALISNSDDFLLDDEDSSPSEYVMPVRYDASPLIIDWSGALKLLNDRSWPWPLLTPIYIHPSISNKLLSTLKDSYSKYPKIDFYKWEKCIWNNSK